MRVVELDRSTLRQRMQVAVGLQVALHDVLQRGRDEEIFLPQPQLAPSDRGVARVEDFRDRFGAHLLAQRTDMVATVERIEPQRIGSARRPQPQRIHVLAAQADDRRVVGDRLDRLVRVPDRAPRAAPGQRFDPAAEWDVVDHLRAHELPRVGERQPVLRIFLLPAVLDHLPEQPVVVADAVAAAGNAKRRHPFHEAGGEAAQAAVAERRVGLGRAQAIEVDAEVAERARRRCRSDRDCDSTSPNSRPIRNSSDR